MENNAVKHSVTIFTGCCQYCFKICKCRHWKYFGCRQWCCIQYMHRLAASNTCIQFVCTYACIHCCLTTIITLETLWIQAILLHPLLANYLFESKTFTQFGCIYAYIHCYFLKENCRHWKYFGCRQWWSIQYFQTVLLGYHVFATLQVRYIGE